MLQLSIRCGRRRTASRRARTRAPIVDGLFRRASGIERGRRARSLKTMEAKINERKSYRRRDYNLGETDGSRPSVDDIIFCFSVTTFRPLEVTPLLSMTRAPWREAPAARIFDPCSRCVINHAPELGHDLQAHKSHTPRVRIPRREVGPLTLDSPSTGSFVPTAASGASRSFAPLRASRNPPLMSVRMAEERERCSSISLAIAAIAVHGNRYSSSSTGGDPYRIETPVRQRTPWQPLQIRAIFPASVHTPPAARRRPEYSDSRPVQTLSIAPHDC